MLDEFVPEERIVNKIEAVLRVFNKYGNRKNKNKARLKFVMRERGLDWMKEQIELEFQDILTNGGIPVPKELPEGFGGFESNPQPVGSGALLPIVDSNLRNDPDYNRWLKRTSTNRNSPATRS